MTLVEHAPIRTVADVEAFAPDLLATMVKTIAFRVKDGPLVLVAVHGQSRVDYKRVAKLLGVSRRALRSLSPDDVEAELGVLPGGVAPVLLSDEHRLIVDEAVLAMPLIHTGSGRFDVTFEVDPNELFAAVDATVAKVTK